MIDDRFAVIGLWVVAMLVTLVVVCLLAFMMSHGSMHEEDSFAIALVIFVMILELVICTVYVTLKNNPEKYGYMRIEQEVSE